MWLEYPQYTRPREFHGKEVPEVLLSGHHANIEKWRMERAIETTMDKRPDMICEEKMSRQEKKIYKQVLAKRSAMQWHILIIGCSAGMKPCKGAYIIELLRRKEVDS